MKIKVIGCSGAGFSGCNVSCFLLNDEILFDAGSLPNVLDEKSLLKIRNIFISHAHLDHIVGIPFLADNIIGNMNHRVDHRVNIFSISPVLKTIKKHLFNNSVWPDFTIIPHPDNAILNLIKLNPGKSIKINDYIITPYKVNHIVPAAGFLVEDTKKKRFFYTGDTGPSSETWEKIGDKKIHCLIIEISFPNSMYDMAIKTGHLTPSLLKEELSKMRHLPEHIYVTHLKPRCFKEIKADIAGLEMKNIKLLKCGNTIKV